LSAFDSWIPGVLCKKQMEALVVERILQNALVDADDLSSIDLHLTAEAYQLVRGTVKPGGEGAYLAALKDQKLAHDLPPKDGVFHLLPRQS